MPQILIIRKLSLSLITNDILYLKRCSSLGHFYNGINSCVKLFVIFTFIEDIDNNKVVILIKKEVKGIIGSK